MATKKNKSTETDTPQNAYFLSLELENVRCFGERQKIDFSDGKGKHKQWTIILGDNGTGKTTILQGLVVMSPDKSDDYLRDVRGLSNILGRINSFFGKDRKSEIVLEVLVGEAHQSSRTSFEVKSTPDSDGRLGETSSSIIPHDIANVIKVLAYGASRKAGETSLTKQTPFDFFITLLNEKTFLLNPEEWLIQADYSSKRESNSQNKRLELLKQVIEVLKTVLPDVEEIRFREKELLHKKIPLPIVEFKTPYGWVEAKDLSLGFRTSMAWMVDFAARMFDLYPESKNPLAEPAVVLIDEIDLHLHPKWQRDLLDWLSKLCPNTQFIVTTHSPLIVQAAAARDANIVVCKREGDRVVIDQSIEAVQGWRADQLLVSDLFGLPSTRDTQIERLEKRQKELASKGKLAKTEDKELKELSTKINALRSNENKEDDKAMEIIRKAATYLQNNGSK
jgi:predicted ATP-binding protein involved in virulence